MKTLTILVIWAALAVETFAKSGPEIPTPKQTLCEAVERVSRYFNEEFDRESLNEADRAYRKACIITQVTYGAYYDPGVYDNHPRDRSVPLGEGCWIIELTHPVHNDHSWRFVLWRNGWIELKGHSI